MKNTKILIDHFGVHLSPDGLWFLEQEGNSQNARGLDVRSPFMVKTARAANCPHSILLADRGLTDLDLTSQSKLLKNALGRMFLPIPSPPQIVFVEQTPERLQKVLNLLALNSPHGNGIMPAWMATPGALRATYRSTNIQPLVITNIDVRWMTQNRYLLDLLLTGTRPIILLGDADVVLPTIVKRLDGKMLDKIKIKNVNLSRIGANTLYKFMRNEL